MKCWPLLALPILLGSGLAQSVQGGPSATYLLRLERITPEQDTCLLLRTDRKYRLEQMRGGHTDVFDAELSEAALSEVEQQLNTGGLGALTQDKIPAPIIPSRQEVVAMSIPQNTGWRNLEFHAPESWEAVKRPMDQLLKLLKGLHKTSGPALGEEKANRCLPPGSPPGQAPASSGATAEGAGGHLMLYPPAWPFRPPAPPQFLVRLRADKVTSDLAERNCLLVFPDGRYHLERSTQWINSRMKSQIFEGKLIDIELKQLLDLLRAPDLLNAKSSTLPHQARVVSREVAITTVSISREKSVQTLQTAHFVGVQVGVAARDAALGDTRPLEPFLVWTRIIESHPLTPLPDAVPSDCALSQN